MSNNKNIVEDGKATRFSSTNQSSKSRRKLSLYNQPKEMAKLDGNVDLLVEDFTKIILT